MANPATMKMFSFQLPISVFQKPNIPQFIQTNFFCLVDLFVLNFYFLKIISLFSFIILKNVAVIKKTWRQKLRHKNVFGD